MNGLIQYNNFICQYCIVNIRITTYGISASYTVEFRKEKKSDRSEESTLWKGYLSGSQCHCF